MSEKIVKSGGRKAKERKELVGRIQASTKPVDSYFIKKSKVADLELKQSNIILHETESNQKKRPREQNSQYSEIGDSETPPDICISSVELDKTETNSVKKVRYSESTIIDSDDLEIPTMSEIKEEEPCIQMQDSHTRDFFTYANKMSPELYWGFHPKQPMHGNLPFKAKKVYFRTTPDERTIPRKWVTYDEDNKKLYCSQCLMYAPPKYSNIKWISGYTNFENITKRLSEHAKSDCHQISTEIYLSNKPGKPIENCFAQQQTSLRKKQIEERREVLKCIIDILFFIGIQALPYRSDRNESLATAFAENQDENSGNFLELVKLLSEYNRTLKKFLQDALKKDKRLNIKKGKKGKKGRGKKITFLSKNTVDKIFGIIGDMIKETIVKEVKAAGMYSVQMDSTQDISSHDQCAIVVRYVVSDMAKERLLRLVNVESSTGKNLHNLLSDSISDVGLSLKTCIADSFDGAANMSGIYSGVQALMKEARPSHIHTWCYAHVLNLVIGDASGSCLKAEDLFKLLNDLCTFFKESYKRIAILDKQMKIKTGSSKFRRPERIGQTRWSSKGRGLRKLFGTFDDKSKEFLSDLLIILKEISDSTEFKSKVRSDAHNLKEYFCRFETILSAFTFIRIFDITTPISDYLQTTGLDVLQAWRMINDAIKKIKEISRDFKSIYLAATAFIGSLNKKLAAEDIQISTTFTEIRSTRAPLDGISDPLKTYEITCHNINLDAALESMKTRYQSHGELYKQISCFDPKRFQEVLKTPERLDVSKIVEAIPNIQPDKVIPELKAFASTYKRLQKGLFEPESDYETDSETDSDVEKDTD